MRRAARDGAQNGSVTYPIARRNTVRRQRVDIRCGDIRTAVESDIAVTEVIGEDDHNIGRPILLRKHWRGQTADTKSESDSAYA